MKIPDTTEDYTFSLGYFIPGFFIIAGITF